MDALLFMFKLSLTEGAALRFCRPCIPNALNAGEGIVVPVFKILQPRKSEADTKKQKVRWLTPSVQRCSRRDPIHTLPCSRMANVAPSC